MFLSNKIPLERSAALGNETLGRTDITLEGELYYFSNSRRPEISVVRPSVSKHQYKTINLKTTKI